MRLNEMLGIRYPFIQGGMANIATVSYTHLDVYKRQDIMLDFTGVLQGDFLRYAKAVKDLRDDQVALINLFRDFPAAFGQGNVTVLVH